MTWGMSYEMFWHGSLTAYFCYMQKVQKEDRRKSEETDFCAWRQGKYFRDALLDVYNMFNGMIDQKKALKYPYPSKPYYLIQQEEEEKQKKADLFADKAKEIEAYNAKLQEEIKKRASGAPSD